MLIVIKALDNQKKMTYCFSVIINVTSVCLWLIDDRDNESSE